MSEGDVTITMDRSKAPCTVNSFVSLADQGFYDKTDCHRLADTGIFFLQCGDPTGTGDGGPGYQFANETDGNEKYRRGVVAMANAGPNTNGSQFMLFWDDSSSLDAKHELHDLRRDGQRLHRRGGLDRRQGRGCQGRPSRAGRDHLTCQPE